ncbi:hypothetical protein D3C84_579010 [compost metagenome]
MQQAVSRVDVFADRPCRKTADFGDQIASHHEGRADTKRRIPTILRRLEHIEEHPLLIHPAGRRAEIVLDRVGVVVELRRLHQADPGVVEQPQGAQEDWLLRCKVGVEHQDVRRIAEGRRLAQTVVQVARLGVGIVGAPRVLHAHFGAVVAQPVAPGVVEHPDGEVRVVDGLGGNNGFFEDFQALVVGGDEDIHRRHRVALLAQAAFAGIGRFVVIRATEHHDDGKQRVTDRQHLEEQEAVGPDRGKSGMTVGQGVANPPGCIVDQQKCSDGTESDPRGPLITVGQASEQNHRRQGPEIDLQQLQRVQCLHVSQPLANR